MATVKELQGLVDRVKSGMMRTEEVRDLLHHASPLIRVNALEALVVPAKRDGELLDELAAAASDPANKVHLMGTIAVAHVALGCLLRVGTAEARQTAQALWSTWPEPDRTDLTWYLESEGLQVG